MGGLRTRLLASHVSCLVLMVALVGVTDGPARRGASHVGAEVVGLLALRAVAVVAIANGTHDEAAAPLRLVDSARRAAA